MNTLIDDADGALWFFTDRARIQRLWSVLAKSVAPGEHRSHTALSATIAAAAAPHP